VTSRRTCHRIAGSESKSQLTMASRSATLLSAVDRKNATSSKRNATKIGSQRRKLPAIRSGPASPRFGQARRHTPVARFRTTEARQRDPRQVPRPRGARCAGVSDIKWRDLREKVRNPSPQGSGATRPAASAAPSRSPLRGRERYKMAERVGFEPTRRLPAHTRSRRAPSTTRPSLRRAYALFRPVW
jgi:hypothetical protein